jgi:hypothetical protein
MIDQPRYAEWVKLSHRLQKFEPFMVVTVQGLGYLDAKLAEEDRAFLARPPSMQDDFEQSLDLTERFTQSCLWVLGAYELIRSIDEKCRNSLGIVSANVATLVSAAKTQFERVGVPLAKYEAARKFSATDRANGIAWHVAPGTFVSREDLAKCFREMLLAL